MNIPHPYATRLANRVVELLTPVTERIQVTGDIRLHRDLVRTIAVVAIPKRRRVQKTLFDTELVPDPAFGQALDQWVQLEGAYTDPLVKRWLPGFFTLEVHVADQANFGLLLALTTGNFAFRKTLQEKWSRRKWTCRKGYMYRKKTMEIISVPEERDLFDLLKMAYVEPHDRNYELTDAQREKLGFTPR